MDIGIFLEKFAQELGCDASQLAPETQFKKLSAWSSLNALLVLSMIEEEFGVLLKGDDFKNSETLGDIFKIIQSRKN